MPLCMAIREDVVASTAVATLVLWVDGAIWPKSRAIEEAGFPLVRVIRLRPWMVVKRAKVGWALSNHDLLRRAAECCKRDVVRKVTINGIVGADGWPVGVCQDIRKIKLRVCRSNGWAAQHITGFEVREQRLKPGVELSDIFDIMLAGNRQLIVVLRIHHHREAQLADVGQTRCLARFFSGLSKDWEENRSEDSDDSDDDEELDERKGTFV